MLEPNDDFDGRIRDWLEPDQLVVKRVMSRALAAQQRGRRIGRVLAVWVLASLLMTVVGTWIWRATSTDVDEFTATFDGDVLLIRATDGTTAILGPPGGDPLPSGTGRVIFEGEGR